ncbi:unnamed protein product [Amoebophrya sp. A120]|nr:unnamed protein product [Amoebophrya sp. A120]|eukprot:GSA120T00010874001.1
MRLRDGRTPTLSCAFPRSCFRVLLVGALLQLGTSGLTLRTTVDGTKPGSTSRNAAGAAASATTTPAAQETTTSDPKIKVRLCDPSRPIQVVPQSTRYEVRTLYYEADRYSDRTRRLLLFAGLGGHRYLELHDLEQEAISIGGGSSSEEEEEEGSDDIPTDQDHHDRLRNEEDHNNFYESFPRPEAQAGFSASLPGAEHLRSDQRPLSRQGENRETSNPGLAARRATSRVAAVKTKCVLTLGFYYDSETDACSLQAPDGVVAPKSRRCQRTLHAAEATCRRDKCNLSGERTVFHDGAVDEKYRSLLLQLHAREKARAADAELPSGGSTCSGSTHAHAGSCSTSFTSTGSDSTAPRSKHPTSPALQLGPRAAVFLPALGTAIPSNFRQHTATSVDGVLATTASVSTSRSSSSSETGEGAHQASLDKTRPPTFSLSADAASDHTTTHPIQNATSLSFPPNINAVNQNSRSFLAAALQAQKTVVEQEMARLEELLQKEEQLKKLEQEQDLLQRFRTCFASCQAEVERDKLTLCRKADNAITISEVREVDTYLFDEEGRTTSEEKARARSTSSTSTTSSGLYNSKKYNYLFHSNHNEPPHQQNNPEVVNSDPFAQRFLLTSYPEQLLRGWKVPHLNWNLFRGKAFVTAEQADFLTAFLSSPVRTVGGNYNNSPYGHFPGSTTTSSPPSATIIPKCMLHAKLPRSDMSQTASTFFLDMIATFYYGPYTRWRHKWDQWREEQRRKQEQSSCNLISQINPHHHHCSGRATETCSGDEEAQDVDLHTGGISAFTRRFRVLHNISVRAGSTALRSIVPETTTGAAICLLKTVFANTLELAQPREMWRKVRQSLAQTGGGSGSKDCADHLGPGKNVLPVFEENCHSFTNTFHRGRRRLERRFTEQLIPGKEEKTKRVVLT